METTTGRPPLARTPSIGPPLVRPPLVRHRHGRIFAGVGAGVADHLRLPVLRVRVAMVAGTALFGLGVIAYAGLWALMPAATDGATASSSPEQDPPAADPSRPRAGEKADQRGARRLTLDASGGPRGYVAIAAMLVAAVIGISIIAQVHSHAVAWGVAGVVALLGASLSWDQMSRASDDAARPDSRGRVWFSVGSGWTIATLALVAALARGRAVSDVFWAVFAGAVLLAATGLILLPVGLRLWRDLGAERSARAREAERADIAAHLHDSVLQTLALIRARSHDPAAVTALARSQERELRQWLYTDPVTAQGSMSAAVTDIAARVEEAWGVPIEVVTVGEADPGTDGDRARALLAAAREALINAARHAGSEVRVFAEFTPQAWEVFVRDRGPGFDLGAIPTDRAGVRESILARMERHGGRAEVRTAAGEGTEVHLRLEGPFHTEGGEEE